LQVFGFEWPFVLILLLFAPLIFLFIKNATKKRLQYAAMFSRLELLKQASMEIKETNKTILPYILTVAVVSGIIALARPYINISLPADSSRLILAFDISISMQADDMSPNRLETARQTAIDFLKKLPHKIETGLVYFYGSSYIAASPTLKRENLINKLKDLNLSELKAGTAIGAAIDSSANSMLDGENIINDMVIILVTDGENNQGISPIDAANKAKQLGIKIFTIGIGKKEGAIVKGYQTYLDEGTLIEIANITNGKYYHADSEKQLKRIYNELINNSFYLKKQKTDITFIFSGISFIAYLFVILVGISIYRPVF